MAAIDSTANRAAHEPRAAETPQPGARRHAGRTLLSLAAAAALASGLVAIGASLWICTCIGALAALRLGAGPHLPASARRR